MKSRFDEFIEKIPENLQENTKTFIGKNLAIFIPDSYEIKKGIVHEDYHFVIFHTTPPPATINSREYHLKSGTLLCMPPGTEIIVGNVNTKLQAKYAAISIKRDFFQEIFLKICGNKKIESFIYNHHYSYKTIDLLEFFIEEFVLTNGNSSLMLDSIEIQIVIQLLRDMNLDPLISKNNKCQEKSYVEQAIKYIESYYNSNITINEICNYIYISPCHFQRIFKKAMKKTPHQYILEFRLKKAKEKLEEGLSIGDIAKLCGFLSSNHFSLVFKKNEGITPSKYRNALRNGNY